MCRFSTRLLVSTAAILLVVTTARSQELLRWRFQKGHSAKYQMTEEIDMDIQQFGQDVEVKITQKFDFGWTVADISDDGSATIKFIVSRFRTGMNDICGCGASEYDSDSGEDQPLAPPISVMVGKEFTIRMTPRGEITVPKVPEGNDDSPEDMAELLKSLTHGSTGPVFHAEPVEEGARWEDTRETTMYAGTTVVIQNNLQYLGVEKRNGRTLHTIRLSAIITPKSDERVRVSIKEQQSEGKVLFDLEAGEIVESTWNQTAVIHTEAGGQVIVASARGTVTMKRTDGTGSKSEP